MNKPSGKIVIIGAGNVGSTIAFNLLVEKVGTEVFLIDINKDLVNSQVLDLQDASMFYGSKVSEGDYKQINDGDIIIIASGSSQQENQSRMDLFDKNVAILRDIISLINSINKDIYVCIVTNPVDVLTYVAVKELALPSNQIFGSGTSLDSIRLKRIFQKNRSNFKGVVMGEHGDTSLPILENEIKDDEFDKLINEVRSAAHEIIRGKKSTNYGIASSTTNICKSILNNTEEVVLLSVLLQGEYGFNDVCISIPVILGSTGVKKIPDLNLNIKQMEMFAKSVSFLKEKLKEI